MATSTFPRVKARVVQLLGDSAWPGEPPQVSYGQPARMDREVVMVGGTVDTGDQEFVALGGRKRDERYRLRVVVQVSHPGESQQEATERAFELFGVLELLVRANPSLDLPDVFVAEIAQPQVVEAPGAEGGYVASIISGLGIRARI